MSNREKAIQWAEQMIAQGAIKKPVRFNAWEVIENPILFLQTNIQRIKHASPKEQQLAYNRIRNLKHNLSK